MYPRVSNDYLPLFWVGRVPVYVTTFLVGLYVAAAVALALSDAMGSGNAGILVFSSAKVLQEFHIWRIASYSVVQSLGIWFAVEMLFFFWFGREVERYLGRQAYGGLYVTMLIAMPVVLLFVGPWMPLFLAGTSLLHLGVFVAFAVLYPTAELIFRIQARWFALAAVGISALTADRSGLVALVAMLVALFFYLCQLGVSNAVGAMSGVKRMLGMSGSPVPKQKLRKPKKIPVQDPAERIDAILEKISREGLSSLSPQEREELQRARQELLAQERKS